MQLKTIAVVSALWLTSTLAYTQSEPYPSRPIKLSVGYPAGGAPDVTAHAVANN